MQSNASLTGPSLTLVVIAALMLQLVLFDRQGLAPGDWVQLVIAVTLALFIPITNRIQNQRIRSLLADACLLLLFALPFLWDFIQRIFSLGGHPVEVQFALTLRNLMFGIMMKRSHARRQELASMMSCFVALSSLLWLMNHWTIVLMFVYIIVGMWWLMGAYWNRISGCFPAQSKRCIPWKPICCAFALGAFAVVLLLPLAAGKSYTIALQGFMPSSGGTRWEDDHAYGGIGSGAQMVSAKEDANSFGPIETELFLESKMPSLYDAFNEFTEPAAKEKIKKKHQRAISLAPSQMKKNHKRRSVNQQASREFSTIRKHKEEELELSDLRSTALLQIEGRVPVHLGLHTYDLWDGHNLTTSNSVQPLPLTLDSSNEDGKKWVRYAGPKTNELLTYWERHKIRILNLKTNRVPSPPNTVGAHINKMRTEGLFTTTQDGMLALDMEFIPQLSMIHVESSQRNAAQLPQLIRSEIEADLGNDSINNLARSWTQGVPEGWPQIEAICNRLREDYTLDSQSLVPEKVEDAASYFLFDAKRGPDYLFATSASLLFRSLGYETRVVSGFYANPDHYDYSSRLTSVYAADAHFWVEILASSPVNDSTEGVTTQELWITVEPSPGYEVLLAPESLRSKLFSAVFICWQTVSSYPLTFLVFSLFVVVFWIKRTNVYDFVLTTWWKIQHYLGDSRHKVIATLRLLDRRAKVHGQPRAKGIALNNWLSLTYSQRTYQEMWEGRFLHLANWALYGENAQTAYSHEEIIVLCTQAAAMEIRPSKKRQKHSSSITKDRHQ
ncbi:MAG: transglutaminase-like domain-containing protein [Pirellulaceae bacterium]|nr:transglutaminase-like domain-containing protein [Pirellulaceae bacterium]